MQPGNRGWGGATPPRPLPNAASCIQFRRHIRPFKSGMAPACPEREPDYGVGTGCRDRGASPGQPGGWLPARCVRPRRRKSRVVPASSPRGWPMCWAPGCSPSSRTTSATPMWPPCAAMASIPASWDARPYPKTSCGGRCPVFPRRKASPGWTATWAKVPRIFWTPPWILDIDTTIKPLRGRQEGAVVS